jgi:hypothetical protein
MTCVAGCVPGRAPGPACSHTSVNDRPAGFLYYSLVATGINTPPVNFQAGMQQPGILQPAEADSQSIGRRRFTERVATPLMRRIAKF